jgi:thioredoxin 2
MTAGAITTCPSCSKKNRVPVSSKGTPRCASCHVDLPWLVDANDDSLDTAIDTSQLVLVDLWAAWCGPCRQIAPILQRLSTEFAGRLKVVKVDVDANPLIAQKFEARSIPLLKFMKNSHVVDTVVGAQSEHVLRTLVERHLR